MSNHASDIKKFVVSSTFDYWSTEYQIDMVISHFLGYMFNFNLNKNDNRSRKEVFKRSCRIYSGIFAIYFIKQTDTKFGSESIYLLACSSFSLLTWTTKLW